MGPGARWPDDTVTASPARLTFVRGGFKVEATSTGRSILVLPIQFSNCLVPQIVAGDATAHLMRIDLALTGLVFDRAVEINVQYRQWPRAPATCQALDHQEITQLLK